MHSNLVKPDFAVHRKLCSIVLYLPLIQKVGFTMSMKTTVDLVQDVNRQIEATIESCSSEKKRAKIEKSLTNLKTSLSQVLSHLTDNEKRKFISVRKGLKAVFNIVDGALEGIASHELSPREFRATLNTLKTKFYPSVCSSLSAEIEKAESEAPPPVVLTEEQEAVKREIAESADYKEALKAVKKIVKEAETGSLDSSALKSDEATIKQLQELADMRKNLPVRVKTDFQVVRMPVVPIFSNHQLNNANTFAKLGIKHLLIEGYAVLLNQIVIAVSKKRAAASGLSPLEFAQSAVALINERGSTEYEFVTDESHLNVRNTDIHLFWLLPKLKMNALMRVALTGRKASTVKWDFPL